MQGDPLVIRLLQAQLRNELTAINRYFVHYRMFKHWGFERMAKKEYDESIGEMKHADALMERLVDATSAYLTAQAEAGAQVLQIFDSWVGNLGPDDYRRFVQPHMRRLLAGLPADVPVIHFGTDTGSILELQRDAGGHVIGLDYRVDLAAAWERLGPGVGVQGNLDPVALFAPIPELERQTRRILDQAAGRPGHIFNLGHGILPNTPVDHVRAVVDMVRSHRPDRSATAPS